MEKKKVLLKKLKDAVRGKTVINMLDVNKLGKAAIPHLSSMKINPEDYGFDGFNYYHVLGQSFHVDAYQTNKWIWKLLELMSGRKVKELTVLYDLTEEEKKICGKGRVCDGLVMRYNGHNSIFTGRIPIDSLDYYEDHPKERFHHSYYLQASNRGETTKRRFERFKKMNGERIEKILHAGAIESLERIAARGGSIGKFAEEGLKEIEKKKAGVAKRDQKAA